MTRQYPLPLPHREAMAADDYCVTSSNREAAAWVHAWPAWPSHCLVVTGPSGSGKTHLLNLWLQRSHGKSVTIDAMDTQQMREANIVAIDDAEKIAGNPEFEESLFHLYNLLKEKKGFLLLTASTPPAQWNIALPDLRSRVLAAPIAAIGVPDDELLTMLLVKQFHDRQIEVSAEIITYLVPRLERTAAALRKLVNDLDCLSLAEGRRITVALARRLLEDQSFPTS